MVKNILITGGSGLIGTELTSLLQRKGYKVGWLSRSKSAKNSSIELFNWDVENQEIDLNALYFADVIVNLAGAGIADRPWTTQRKQEIIDSRVNSIKLIAQSIKAIDKTIESFISASGVGYYGNRNDEVLMENALPDNDFLGRCCVEWENAADEINQLGVRTVKLRTGIVLSMRNGALPKMLKPVQLGAGAALGTGRQWMSWIHLIDMVNIYLHAIENPQLSGAFNAVAPNPVTNKQFTNSIAKCLNKSIWLPNVPGFVLKIALGEMSHLVLDSDRCSAKKILESGFLFEYENLDEALTNLLSR
ncbi:TIGR01777 family oxidoreductase [Solitalea lacus]|uniref:TIGR01777 family oxidoreductase n=1 Tax=Solitalea lacus TaxID=2911172 RepID=UPI001EDA8FBC|nr:TIGR01777 family oxidoreductase [Solitalea lacus]UKJ07193.1 TIGR01777 family oxidoreductase [Solitalea lacus]